MKSNLLIGLMLLMGSMTASSQQLALTSGRANSRSGIKTSSDASLSLVAFPGAQGWGRFATGGRTGSVYHVTNLNDKEMKAKASLRVITDQPEGELKTYNRAGNAVYVSGGYLTAGEQSGRHQWSGH